MHLNRVTAIRENCRENILKAQNKFTEYVNNKRTDKEIEVGQRVFAKLDKYVHKNKLDLPIHGPFNVIGRVRNAMKLKEVGTTKTYIVHPDYIVPSPAQMKISVSTNSDVPNSPKKKTPKQLEKTTSRYNLRPR